MEFDANKFFRKKINLKFVSDNEKFFRLDYFNINQLLEIHLNQVPNSKIGERKNVYLAFKSFFGSKKMNELDYDALSSWFQRTKDLNNYTEKNLAHIKIQLNNFFKWLTKKKIIDQNPLNEIKFRQNLPPLRDRVVFKIKLPFYSA